MKNRYENNIDNMTLKALQEYVKYSKQVSAIVNTTREEFDSKLKKG